MSSFKNSQGFSLIELLVAVVVLAVGILGVAGMQVISLQQNRSALYRAEAVQLANDLMDRIRVNTDITYTALMSADPQVTTDCIQNACSRTDMAAYDISQWKCSINSLDSDGTTYTACAGFQNVDGSAGIEGALPEGAGSVALVSGVYEVTVQWQDDSQGTMASITLRAQVN